MSEPFLPYGRQDITDADEAAVIAALRSDYLTTGPLVPAFEAVFAAYTGAPHAVAVANGTAALHLAALALDIGPGDVVLAPAMSFAASANGARYTGADIEFMDCDPDSGLVTLQNFCDAADRAERTGRAAKMAVIVHLNGEHADMAAIAGEAKRRGILLVEDACHALGSEFVDADGATCRVGSCRYSAMACYSTHPVKTITTGEGGLITTDDAALADKLVRLRSHGITRDAESFTQKAEAFDEHGNSNPWYYEMQTLGFNYRLTDIACALGISQMGRIEEIASRRRALKARYDALFAKTNLPVRPVASADKTNPVRHLYPVLTDFEAAGISRAQFSAALRERGIGTQVHYIPVHKQPYYQALNSDLKLPGCENYYARVLSLPLFPAMKDSDPERVVDAISAVLKN